MWLPQQKQDIAYYSNKISHIGYLFIICSIWYITNFHVYQIFLSQSVFQDFGVGGGQRMDLQIIFQGGGEGYPFFYPKHCWWTLGSAGT